MLTKIQTQIEESIQCKRILKDDQKTLKTINHVVESCINSLKNNGKIIFAGNGGSFADAQHLSAEFVSRFMFDRAPLASVALGVNGSAISAIGNDYGYENVFSREFEAIAERNDIVVAISTSGNSPNIINLIKSANNNGIQVFGFTGRNGGLMSNMCTCINVPSDDTARIQESHILIGHIIYGIVEEEYFKG